MDPEYEPDEFETRTIFGLHLAQKRNNVPIDRSLFKHQVTSSKDVSDWNASVLMGFLAYPVQRANMILV